MDPLVLQQETPSIQQFTEAAISIFALVNPIGNLPVFASLTEDVPVVERRAVFRLAASTALGVIVAMALAGQVLVEMVFHLTLDEFAFAGGLVLVVVGIRRIVSESPGPRPAMTHADSRITLAVSPIALPLLVGPGSIANVMLITQHFGRLYAVLACLTGFSGVFLVLHFSGRLYRLMGRVGTLAVGRVMQIFIVAFGVKFCFRSLVSIFQMSGIGR